MPIKYHCPSCGKRFVEWGAEKLGFKCPDCEGEGLVRVGQHEDGSVSRRPSLKKIGHRMATRKVAKAEEEALVGVDEEELETFGEEEEEEAVEEIEEEEEKVAVAEVDTGEVVIDEDEDEEEGEDSSDVTLVFEEPSVAIDEEPLGEDILPAQGEWEE